MFTIVSASQSLANKTKGTRGDTHQGKAEIYERNNNLQKIVQLNEAIYEKSITHNFGKGLIYSCYKLSDFFESIDRYDWANPYLKYINKIKMAEGDRELNERILLAEKEKKIDVEIRP